MRLGNILKQAGGTPETGRPVRFQLRQKGQGGKVTRKWCDAVILPLGEDERAAALSDARSYCSEHPEADGKSELALRLAQAFLHDADNAGVKFALQDELPQLRAGLVEDQLAFLLGEYSAHIAEEYPELQPAPDRAELERKIAALQKQLAQLAEHAAGE